MNAIDHFNTITKHKFIVMKYCFKVGLYKQGILHDLSKYSWIEFSAGIKYYKGDKSPNGEQRLAEGRSEAWLHHKGRNKHHNEYWIDYIIGGKFPLGGMKMPIKYVVEMFIDRLSACKNYEKENFTVASPLAYYERSKNYCIIHDESRALLEELLFKLKEEGEEKTLKYIKEDVLRRKE